MELPPYSLQLNSIERVWAYVKRNALCSFCAGTTGELKIPEGCSLFAVVRDGVATPLRPDMILQEGDKVIAIGRGDCEEALHEQLIGTLDEAQAGA